MEIQFRFLSEQFTTKVISGRFPIRAGLDCTLGYRFFLHKPNSPAWANWKLCSMYWLKVIISAPDYSRALPMSADRFYWKLTKLLPRIKKNVYFHFLFWCNSVRKLKLSILHKRELCNLIINKAGGADCCHGHIDFSPILKPNYEPRWKVDDFATRLPVIMPARHPLSTLVSEAACSPAFHKEQVQFVCNTPDHQHLH